MEKLKRASGILMHITSLPSDFGWGTFSRNAFNFIDKMKQGGFGVWQVLPFVDTIYNNSPYSGISSVAINPNFLDISKYLDPSEIDKFGFRENNYSMPEYTEKVRSALELVCEKNRDIDISDFEKKNSYWLDDYALFRSIKLVQKNRPWFEWPEGLKNKKAEDIEEFKNKNSQMIRDFKLIQFLLDRDWSEIKKYANERNIEIFGDMPFYVEMDSAEVWANQKNWQIEKGKPKLIAGTPPDFFNSDGQLWGYPIYNYENMKKNKYSFWANRVKRLGELFDIVRIDHFIAFSRYWAVPGGSKTAKSGKWIKNNSDDILSTILKSPKIKIVAEDLGAVNDGVIRLKEKFQIPGMKIFQYGFDSDSDNVYKPYNYEKNCVAYIGTHDNDTFMGLLNKGNWDQINRMKRYLNLPLEYGNDAVVDKTILDLYKSSANIVIFQMQDLLKLDNDSRMNIPGDGNIENWTWRLRENLDSIDWGRYAEMSRLYGRN